MEKYTPKQLPCPYCKQLNNFLISFKEQNGKTFYLTQCPKCKKYDEIREAYLNELKSISVVQK